MEMSRRAALRMGGLVVVGVGSSGATSIPSTSVYDVKADYGAVGNGIVDDTHAVQSALNAVADSGGLLLIPRGNYSVGPLSLRLTNYLLPVTIRGEATRSSVFSRRIASLAAVLTIDASGVLDVPLSIESLSLTSSVGKSGPGLITINTARARLDRIEISGMTLGWLNQGGLMMTIVSSVFVGNNTGVNMSSLNSVAPNLIHFESCRIIANTVWGLDYNDGDQLLLTQCNFENNGTTGKSTTGGCVIRGNVGTASGSANTALESNWFESNSGYSLLVEDPASAKFRYLSVRDTVFYSPEAGQAARVGKIRGVILDNVRAFGTIALSAISSDVRGGVIGTLNDQSTSYVHRFVATQTGTDSSSKP